MSSSDVMEARFLNWYRGTQLPAPPAGLFVGLFSSDPTDAGAGTEITTAIRAAGRVAVAFGAAAPDGAVHRITSSAAVDFGQAAAGADRTVSHWGVFDAQAGGTLLFHGPVKNDQGADTPKIVQAGDPVSFPVGALTHSQS